MKKYDKYRKAFHGRGGLPPEIADIIGKYVRDSIRTQFRKLAAAARRYSNIKAAKQYGRQRYVRRTGTRGPYDRSR